MSEKELEIARYMPATGGVIHGEPGKIYGRIHTIPPVERENLSKEIEFF